jgi:ABC-2 type transport system ATP-binding protein
MMSVAHSRYRTIRNRNDPMATPLLEVNNVHKNYGSHEALKGVSFQVAAGEMFGLLGPNGAGKTTLLSIISTLLEPSTGEICLLGERITPNACELRRQIGIVPQELAVYGDLTARENLSFFGKLYGVHGATLRERVRDVLAAVGLEDRADDRVTVFSGGMKRRLNLGAALVHRPRLLLLDEPTTGVDPQSRNHIFEGVRRLNAEGVTVMYTSHYMEEVQALCRRVGIIDLGRLKACDALANLLQELQSAIRLRVPAVTPALRERIKQLPDAALHEFPDGALEIECRDVKATLPRLMAALSDLQLNLVSLETEEPNLERVFLHLTGRALRD